MQLQRHAAPVDGAPLDVITNTHTHGPRVHTYTTILEMIHDTMLELEVSFPL